jgi:hypothetical protein
MKLNEKLSLIIKKKELIKSKKMFIVKKKINDLALIFLKIKKDLNSL